MTLATPPTLIHQRYQVLDQLGAGAMGAVYRVQDRLTGQIVALKQMITATSHRLSSDPHSAMLAQEFKFLASLRHPHIISVLDYGFDHQGQPFFTMTLLENAKELVDFAISVDDATRLDLLIQVLQALQYLHRQGILHRDLKPANVLVEAPGQVKVVDFGLASGVRDATMPAGTLVYMAPEVIRGETATLSADLFAVGVMAYEIFAGQPLYDTTTSTFIDLLGKILDTPPDISHLPVDPALHKIINRLLAYNLEERYPSAEAVIQEIAAVSGQPILLETEATRESFLQAAQFVGREAELNQLQEALHTASIGQGSVWLLGGESGVGKSRLLEELQTQALLQGALVLRGQATSERGTPFQLWREALRRLALQTPLSDLDATILKPLLPDIDRLLGRDIPPSPPVDPQALQPRLFATIEGLFRQQSQLMVLLLEDLQWADDSLLLLRRLHEVAGEKPLLIIGTYRSDERPELPDELPMLRQLKLERFADEAIVRLSVSMLGAAGQAQELVDLLKRETEGNVFFMVEVLRTLAEDAGQLAAIGARALPERVFAGGIQTVIQRRLDKVPPAARDLMTIAAVAGREIDLDVLQQISPALDRERWLQQLAPVIEGVETRYRFAHDKLREGILMSLTSQQEPAIHRQLASAIEQVYSGQAEHYAALAYHWHAAHEAAPTVRYATLAGEEALRTGSYREAIRLFEQALTGSQHLTLDEVQLGRLYSLMGDAYWGQSAMSKSREWHSRALQTLGYRVPAEGRQMIMSIGRPLLRHVTRRLLRLRPTSDQPERLMIAARSFDQIIQGSYHDSNLLLGLFGIFHGINAVEMVGDHPAALPLQARYYSTFGFALGDVGWHRLAKQYFDLAARRLQQQPDPETSAWYQMVYGIYQAGQGQWGISNALIESACQYAQSAGNVRLWLQAMEFRIQMLIMQGRFNEAQAHIAIVLPIALRDENTLLIGRYHMATIWLLYLQGQPAAADKHYQQTSELIAASLAWGDQRVGQMALHGILTSLHQASGQWEQAKTAAAALDQEFDKAQTISSVLGGEVAASIDLYLTLWEQGDPAYRQLAAHRLKRFHQKYTRSYPVGQPLDALYQSWFHWLDGRPEQARQYGTQAIAAARAYQMPYYEAQAHDLMARFLPEKERAEHQASAATLYEGMGVDKSTPA